MRKVIPVILFLCLLLVTARESFSAPTLEELFKKGQEAYAAKQYDTAVSYFLQVSDMLVAAKQPAKAQLVLGSNVAVIQLQQEKFADSLATYEKAMALPGKPEEAFLIKAYRNLAVIHGKLKNNAQKALELEKLVKAASKTPPQELSDIHADLGDTYRELELYGKAAVNYEKAKSLLPSDAKPEVRGKILTALGLCQVKIGDFTQAEANLKMAYDLAGIIKQPQTQAEASSCIGIFQLERGDYAEAAKRINAALDIEKASKLRRNEGVDSNNLGLVLKSAGRYPESTKYFEQAIVIAKEIGNKKDEAIALSNRALAARIQGHLKDARKDYQAALAIYDEVQFQEGRASTLLGLGKISEVEDHDFAQAIALYKEAEQIYDKLGLLGFKAEALNQVGRVLRKTATPKRTTRDLVFADSDEAKVKFPPLDPKTAISESLRAYEDALRLGELSGRKEIIWSARQGIGFASYQNGKLEDALDQYRKAINIVTSMRGSQEQVELLGEFLKGKDDLFTEAIEICAALYQKTKKQEYLNLQMQYDETLRNEVNKANMALVQLKYADPKKQDLYKKIVEMGTQQHKATSSVPLVLEPSKDARPETKAAAALQKEETAQAKVRTTKIEKSYVDLLTEWKAKYPADAVLFDSSVKIDTTQIQKSMNNDQILLNYIQTNDSILILSVTNTGSKMVSVDVNSAQMRKLIRDDFLYKNIEKFGHGKGDELKSYSNALDILEELYKYLIAPVADDLKNKKHIYTLTSKYLSYVPFSALVASKKNGHPRFLIEDYAVSNIRLSFAEAIFKNKKEKGKLKILAVGNPVNPDFSMLGSLVGAKKEIEEASKAFKQTSEKITVQYEEKATESWWISNATSGYYNVFYFATHGVPYSEALLTMQYLEPKVNANTATEVEKISLKTMKSSFSTLSHLNGFLLLAPDKGKNDGFLTIKKLLELDDKTFENIRYVFLSACNTGVAFSPKTFRTSKTEDEMSAKEVDAELHKFGWTPGVDQVSFVDTFMRKGAESVYGTLWFADDPSSFFIMSHFATNLDKYEAAEALRLAQLKYLKEVQNNQQQILFSEKGPYNTLAPIHPFYWAVGTMFGK